MISCAGRRRRPLHRFARPGHQRPGERRQPRGAHPVVVGDEDLSRCAHPTAHRPGSPGLSTRRSGGVTPASRPSLNGPSPMPRPWSASIHSQCRPTRPGSPSPRPPGSSGASGTAARRSSSARSGATLRSYTVGSTAVLDGFGADEWSHSGRGQVLAPWPNRLADGRYEFNGVRAQAALDEPERRNAIHGLVRWMPWTLQTRHQNQLSLRLQLHPVARLPVLPPAASSSTTWAGRA